MPTFKLELLYNVRSTVCSGRAIARRFHVQLNSCSTYHGSSAIEGSCGAIQQYLILGTDTSLKAGSGLSAQIHAVSNVHDVFER